MNKEDKQKIKDWIWQKKFRTYISRSALIDLDEFQDFINAMPEESETAKQHAYDIGFRRAVYLMSEWIKEHQPAVMPEESELCTDNATIKVLSTHEKQKIKDNLFQWWEMQPMVVVENVTNNPYDMMLEVLNAMPEEKGDHNEYQ